MEGRNVSGALWWENPSTYKHVDHPGTSEQRDLQVATPQKFSEIDGLAEIEKRLPDARYYATIRVKWGKEIGRDEHYIAYEKGIVEDTRTGLQWVAGPDKNTSWNQASNWANGLSLAGGGWRMPTIDELKKLYQRGKGTRNMTPLLKTTGWGVWSGENQDGTRTLRFNFNHGYEHWQSLGAIDTPRAFAVRSQR